MLEENYLIKFSFFDSSENIGKRVQYELLLKADNYTSAEVEAHKIFEERKLKNPIIIEIKKYKLDLILNSTIDSEENELFHIKGKIGRYYKKEDGGLKKITENILIISTSIEESLSIIKYHYNHSGSDNDIIEKLEITRINEIYYNVIKD